MSRRTIRFYQVRRENEVAERDIASYSNEYVVKTRSWNTTLFWVYQSLALIRHVTTTQLLN